MPSTPAQEPARQGRAALRPVILLLGLLAAAAVLHLRWATHAGALWRDEIGSVNLAAMPDVSTFREYLAHDNFPAGFFGLLRGWMSVTGGPDTDFHLRVFGVLVGFAGLAALCLNGALLTRRVPWLALGLFGLSPLAIRYGDAVRPHGAGMVAIVATFGLVWQAITTGRWRWYGVAALGAVASVQLLYQNAVLVFGICLAGAFVTGHRRDWKDCLRVLGVGLVAALSLLPYVNLIRQGEIELFRIPTTAWTVWVGWRGATGMGFPAMTACWVVLLAGALAGGWIFRAQRGGDERVRRDAEARTYSVTCLAVITVLFPLFLRATHMTTREWYLLNFLGLAASAMDASFSLMVAGSSRRRWRLVSAGAVLLLAAVVSGQSWSRLAVRQTDVDLIAARLEALAGPDDFIVINPWECGVTFSRYYHGRTAWATVPPLADLRVHRYDLIKRYMVSPAPADALAPVLEKITATLAAGHRVWWVGQLPASSPGAPPPLPPAPSVEFGWQAGAYESGWMEHAARCLATHANRVAEVGYPIGLPVNTYEAASLVVAEAGDLPGLRAASRLNDMLAELGSVPAGGTNALVWRRVPNRVQTQNELGIRRATEGRLDEAVAHFEEALRQDPKHAGAACNLGNVLALQGHPDEAIQQFKAALRLQPGDAEAHYNLGNLLAQLGRKPEAIGHLEAALRCRPDYPAAQQRLAELERQGK